VTTITVSPTAAPEKEFDVPLKARPEPSQPHASGKPRRRAEQIAHIIVIAMLFAAPALMCVRAACANDPDVFWHLRTGEWILQHHAIPQVDPFSGPLAGKPWQAYSWLFEVIVIKLFQGLGLTGIVVYTSAMVLAITVSLYHMIRQLQSDFLLAALLTFATCFSLGHLYTPRPWLFTILLFILELNILMHARRTGRLRELLWLPLIFALWANVHIEFVDGLLVLGVAFVESIAARWWSAAETRIPPAWMGGILITSVLATLANPYGWRVYSVVFDYSSRLATSSSALNTVSELQSIAFRDLPDFMILLFALASAAALAWYRRFPLFESGLLLFAAFASFRSRRDLWVMAIVAAAILASRLVATSKPRLRAPKFAGALSVILAALAVAAAFPLLHVNNAKLQAQVTETLPANAVAAVRAKGYAGPLFDDYSWGGYLIWALRMPVSMDGRASFYGDEKITRSNGTWAGESDWASDPELKSAGLVIGPVNAALTQLLRKDPSFQLAYEDKIAAVFIARKSPSQP
jgi:hypothetical protein